MADFNTNNLFSGGAGMFIQYHDVLKPTYLYAVFKMIINKDTHGLPFHLIQKMNMGSIIEWYKNRRYINPLKQLDYQHILDEKELFIFLSKYMKEDESIYRLSPLLNFKMILNVYRTQNMNFPIWIYSKEEEPNILKDCGVIFADIPFKYVFGNVADCVKQCGQNFTYIFSDIELFRDACVALNKVYAHLLLTSDYRYNYIDGHQTLKYDLKELTQKSFPIRTGTISVYEGLDLKEVFSNIIQGG